jgi:Invasin, domain 3
MRRSIPLACAAIFIALSCDENLPSGPQTFTAQLAIVVSHDTLVVGDSNVAQAQAIDAAGHRIQSLSFTWSSADSGVVGLLAFGSPDTSSGRARRLVGQRTGRASVSIALADPRFASTPASRNETVVVGGVRVLTTHDSTLTAINDTAFAIAAGLVRANGALVPRAGEGVRWVHQGSHTATVGQGDTLRYIARSNGPDTLIATSDFCLAGAKCADTVIARVSQTLTFHLSTHLLRSWSFSDSLSPSATLADRRGTGLAGTSVRFVPASPADSAVVRVGPIVGSNDPSTGAMATPRLISIGNDTAIVIVQALAPDGSTILATDTVTEIVRQVARRVNVEQLSLLLSATDSIPVKAVARDARGAIIADATVTVPSITGVAFHDPWVGPQAILNAPATGSLTPSIIGIALPDSNPLAPQIAVVINAASVSVLAADTVKAGNTQVPISLTATDSTGQPAALATIAFSAKVGSIPAPVVTDANGNVTVVWMPPDSAAAYTLTGVRTRSGGLVTLADSIGRILLSRTVQVIASDPNAIRSTVGISATTVAANGTATVTVTVRDVFRNPVKSATPAAFSVAVTRGAIGAFACTDGVCTATYTAPASSGADAISVQIGGNQVLGSPLAVTIP